ALDPRLGARRDDGRPQAAALRLVEQLGHAGPQLLQVAERKVALAALLVRGVVERDAELLEVRGRVEAVERADPRGVVLHRDLVAVARVELLPRAELGALGVEQQAVEVEEERADRHAPSSLPRPYRTARATCFGSRPSSISRCFSSPSSARRRKSHASAPSVTSEPSPIITIPARFWSCTAVIPQRGLACAYHG